MSVSDLSGLASGPRRAASDSPGPLTRGVVSRAPTGLTDDMIVTGEGSSQAWPFTVRHGRWWPHPDGTLPQHGDPCLVMQDHKTGEPWVLVGPL